MPFRGLEEEEKSNQSVVHKYFLPIDQWERAVWLIIYEQEREFGGSVTGLIMGKQGEASMRLFQVIGKRGFCRKLFSGTQSIGDFLTFTVFQAHRLR